MKSPRRTRGGRRSLRRDERGAALVEFAFVAGPLFALIIAILQTSLTFFAQQNLETTAEKATRQILTGQAQAAGMTAAQFKALVCSKLPPFMKCANVFVDVRAASSFSSISSTLPPVTYDSSDNPAMATTYDVGTRGQIVVARVMYAWTVQDGPFGFDISTMSNGQRLLVSTSVFKTELY